MSEKHIRITSIQGCLIYALDIGYLLKYPWLSDLISERACEEWLINLSNGFHNWSKFGLSKPEFTASEYAKTDRAQRNTFSKSYAKRLLPLEFKIKKSKNYVSDIFTYKAESIRISPQGGISIRLVFESKTVNLSAKETIDEYNRMLKSVPELLQTTLRNFISFWNESDIKIRLIMASQELLEEILYTYEIIDLDFSLRYLNEDISTNSIKNLYIDTDKIPVCELYSIAKMSPTSVQALNDTRLYEFIETDIGGRNDELWSINRERMLRCHPDKDKIHNKAFFCDIKTATEILICQQATFDFLEEWVIRKRKLVLNQMLSLNRMDENEKIDFQEQLREVMGITQLLIEPIILQKNVRHTFYIQATSLLVRCLEIQTSNQRASSALKDFAQLIDSIAGYRYSDIATSMGSIQIQLGKSTRRIGFVTIWITTIGIILTIIQVYLAFKK